MKTKTVILRRAPHRAWSAKNMRLIRAALRVWELKQRDRGAW